jgi:hypothetical protein
VAVLLGLVWLAIAAQLATLVSGRYAPFPDVKAGGPRGRIGVLLSARRAPHDERDALEG